MTTGSTAGRGHRMRPHTADIIIDAWGPDLAGCCEEAVSALIGVCVEYAGTQSEVINRFRIPPSHSEALLLGVLEEVIFVLDTSVLVPVGANVEQAADGGLELGLAMVAREAIETVGPAPKAVALTNLVVTESESGVKCSFLVDV